MEEKKLTLDELIEKLKEKTIKNETFVFAVYREKLADYRKTGDSDSYYSLNGFIWGLYATGFLTFSEKGSLIEELFAISMTF